MQKYTKHINNLLKKLQTTGDHFTEEHHAIARYIKENYKKVSYMELEELSHILNIKPHIINEYLTVVGFDNYADFRFALRTTISSKLKTTDRYQISREIHTKINNTLPLVVNKEMQNMNQLIKNFDYDQLARVIEEVIHAPEIVFVGTRASAPITLYAEYIFNRIGKKTRKFISGGTDHFDFLSTLDRNALVIAFGFARYPKETVRILNFFKKKNFNIISITDNNLSPLVPFSSIVLTVPCESISFVDFYAVPICIVNTIVISVSQLDEETTLKYLNEFEEIAKEIGFYF